MFSDYECIWRTIHLHSQRELQDSIWRPLFRHVQFSIGPYATALLHTTSHDDVSMHAADFCSDRRNPMWKTWFQYIPIQQFNTFCIHFVHLIRIPSYSFLVHPFSTHLNSLFTRNLATCHMSPLQCMSHMSSLSPFFSLYSRPVPSVPLLLTCVSFGSLWIFFWLSFCFRLFCLCSCVLSCPSSRLSLPAPGGIGAGRQCKDIWFRDRILLQTEWYLRIPIFFAAARTRDIWCMSSEQPI